MPFNSIRISFSIPAFVVRSHALLNIANESGELSNKVRAPGGVRLHDLPFLLRQPPFLLEKRRELGVNLSNVVKKRSILNLKQSFT